MSNNQSSEFGNQYFVPSADVSVVLNALLDILERRNGTHTTQRRSIKVNLANLPLPAYFSQTDPTPRLTANEQFIALEKSGFVKLSWLQNEANHILQTITLTEHIIPQRSEAEETRNTETGTQVHTYTGIQNGTRNTLYALLNRTPLATTRALLESLLLADKFRFQDDWRARAISHILRQLKAGKSPAPFNLTDSNLTLDLLTVLQALPNLTTETPYRVFSVRVFNDSKRLETIKRQLVSLARLGNPEWKRIPAEEVLCELNLVANPNYIHLAGNWCLTTEDGEIINLSGFNPSIGFPAAQISSLQSAHAESVLCIENLTTFNQQVDKHTSNHTDNRSRNTKHAMLCTYGNPSPAIRHLLRLLPETTPIYLWSDMDYGGFSILAQFRQQVSPDIQPYLMDIAIFENHAHLSRPITVSDIRNLKRLLRNPILKDIHPTIEHLIKRGLKLEQEAIQIHMPNH